MNPEDKFIWNFSDDTEVHPEGFTNPFRYSPSDLVRDAGCQIISRLAEWSSLQEGCTERALERSFAEGKMIGVLICNRDASDNTPNRNSHKRICFIAAFSGTVKGADGKVTSNVEGFVPPIIDLTDSKGYFKKEEAKISLINEEIKVLISSEELSVLKSRLNTAQIERDKEISEMQERIRYGKNVRDKIRAESSDPVRHKELIKESQFQKAELKRARDRWKENIKSIKDEIGKLEDSICKLKELRGHMSDALQKWIFESAIVHNATGESSSIWDIFKNNGLTPPGGTGDCAAPKLLEFAYRNGLKPIAMGEFWYGSSPATAVRTHGHFYPSCTSKCGPLLTYMMQGLHPSDPVYRESDRAPVIIHEDNDIIVVEKPSGMPSVPGLDGKLSLQKWLCDKYCRSIYAVHRLDMDTSGVMIFAKTETCAVKLQRQFEEHSILKTYSARVSASTGTPDSERYTANLKGTIDLPLSPDYDERPRQKVDYTQGKPAHTEFKVLHTNEDGTSDILLYPHTGRTHQLRVHCAHNLGIGRPIVGDLLYGYHTVRNHHSRPTGKTKEGAISRLCLHALSIRFRHPITGAEMEFTSSEHSY